jgi:hypothetical protein
MPQYNAWIGVSAITPKIFEFLSPNTEESKIKQYVEDAQNLDLLSILDDSLLESINTLLNSSPPDDNELYQFFEYYVKPYLAGATMVRYLPFSNMHLTQWGTEQYTQDGFGQVTDKRFAEMQNHIRSKTSAFESRMINYLKKVNYTLDGIVYKGYECNNVRKKQSFSVLGAGGINKVNRFRDGRVY